MMRNFKIKTLVVKPFNDTKSEKVETYEAGDEIILERPRYEELLAKGFVIKGQEVKEEIKKKKDLFLKDED